MARVIIPLLVTGLVVAVVWYLVRPNRAEILPFISTIGTGILPFAIAWVGWIYTDAMKDKELKVKFIEIATNALREPPTKDNINSRQWATDVIKRYSEIKLSDATVKDLITNIPIYGFGIRLKITVVDEQSNPVAGAAVDLLREVGDALTQLAHASTDSKGETVLTATDSSGGRFHVRIQKEGYEIYSSDVQDISPVTIIQAKLKKRL